MRAGPSRGSWTSRYENRIEHIKKQIPGQKVLDLGVLLRDLRQQGDDALPQVLLDLADHVQLSVQFVQRVLRGRRVAVFHLPLKRDL